ncbi:MAG TPA: hypothetical protein VGR47_01610 [Terracidiphilus sp.]|nr:hypothetical protein [Terracidiphilus sp.]
MFSPARPPFTRRPVPGGTTVSFCNLCFVTVAESQFEAELDTAEKAHACNPVVLEHWHSAAIAAECRNPVHHIEHGGPAKPPPGSLIEGAGRRSKQ